MAKLVVGILLGLVLGMYLDNAVVGEPGQLLSQIQTIVTNFISSWT